MSNAPTPGGKYEFAEHHEDEVLRLVRYLRLTATFMLVFGALSLLAAVLIFTGSGPARGFNGTRALVTAGLLIAQGGCFVSAAVAFRLIVDSKGRDIKHLMGAIHQLGTAFVVQTVGFCLQMILLGVALALGHR